ncbi:CRISPR-associated helicase/endonuclease Cas3 [Brachyspira aalborgi]|jgi:CRISPR-associated endonuclease/helicase Cas3|uniref:CRISPR-associated helicase/endonuclease Cas3 n=1 Tax=Brachyspira aalborgi TaxID=29522 RepID=A0AB38PXS1_9SPIR|nr:CRISPR-associated helicase/endonuclease Cas3 [Brachyspira aalborgi]MBS4763073.1 CRISPR-associated helicase/endonuclease Cas3 [Brachyspira sp.]CCY75833.1 cRISPR-associated helicase Cas3 [Brachyspira sp. CAG:700]TXJ14313.1 CRISPR-associated helicase/endonuclease Cas3 [Brachyspira aalborgi]TXJ19091.1 CRISPR-associated helicase/endonuclease Cas3 [Brachyspira aalborgi]TXJ25217.1 CRISPR-associated helicase/endonuclease Cas3 [Brachyspira aalborgi]
MINKDYFLAKSNKIKNGEFITQTIEEHTNKLIELFNKFKDVYGNYFEEHELELIKIACETHDLGKMNSRFQKKLYNSINREKYFDTNKELNALYEQLNITEIPHGVLSCSFLDIGKLKKEFDTVYIKALASAIYNHHERKVVDNNGIDLEDNKIKKIVESDLFKYYKLYNENLKCNFRGISNNEIKKGVDNDYEFWLKFIVIKGMLNKIDYAASAGLDTLELTPDDASKYVENAFKIKKEKDKNITFPNEVQEFMGKEENKDKNIIVVASTGIGKTEGALLWAGDSKTFYTLPIKVSINAIYKRIWDENYYDKNKFTFLHSDAKSIMRKDEEIDDYQLKYIETRHLIYPLTICTVDQLFYFVFKSLGTEKYAATLKYSKIIIDEIQSYTPDIISFLIFGFKVVNDLGGKFCIMTATLPPIVKYFLEETIGKENIKIAEKPFYKKDNEENIIIRHKIKYEEKDFEYNEILEKAKNNKVLIICNMVRRSQDVYIKLKEKNKQNTEINLLHSRFIFRDRKLKEEKIQEFASTKEEKRNNDAGIWISTQIVEASLDIDFDVLYTDMCSADSLLQRMGRCYRNRIYKENEPNIFIYDTKVGVGNGKNSVYDLELYNRAVDFIKEYDNKIFTEEDKQDYINKVYDIEKLKNIDNKDSYYNTIKKNIKDLEIFPIGGIDKGTAEEQFRNIQNITVIPRIFYKELNEKNIFQKYKEAFGEDKIDIIDEIMDYTLSAPLYFREYCIKEIKNKGLEHIFISNSKYDKELGLIKELDEKLEFENRCI